MNTVNWKMLYAVAIFLDIVGFLTAALGVGLGLNRVLVILAIPSFAFYFYTHGATGWWRIIVGGLVEEVPIIGDFLPFWIGTVWRIHKKNPTLVEMTEDAAEERARVIASQNQEDEQPRRPQEETAGELAREIGQ